MKTHIQHYVLSCTVCQQAKLDRTASPALLQPLPIPLQPWELISMDFVDGLPQSSKFSYFIPLAHPYTEAIAAQLYLQQIYKIHGLPTAIVSDYDPVFTSHFWQELFKPSGTKLRLSTINHPQTDGQTERVNHCVETFLCSFTQACPRRWSFWIPLAQFWYNNAHHSAIGMTPLKAMFGYEPRHWGISAHTTCSVPTLKS